MGSAIWRRRIEVIPYQPDLPDGPPPEGGSGEEGAEEGGPDEPEAADEDIGGPIEEGREWPQWTAGRQEQPDEFKPSADDERPGVCLSGGGIRSASFSLGALQAIQNSDLRPTYVTSVSGGGYMAGAWESLRTDTNREDVEDAELHAEAGGQAYVAGVGDDRAGRSRIFEPRSSEERWLRHHTDYLVSSAAVIGGAVAALLGGMIVNLTILFALTSSVFTPLGWSLGTTHPELRAREPIVTVDDQPEVEIQGVEFEEDVPLEGDETGPGYVVELSVTAAKLDVAEAVEDKPEGVEIGSLSDQPDADELEGDPTEAASGDDDGVPEDQTADAADDDAGWCGSDLGRSELEVSEAVLAERESGLEIVRDPTLVVSCGTPTDVVAQGDSTSDRQLGDPNVQTLAVAQEPTLTLGSFGDLGGPPSEELAPAVRRALSIEEQPRLRTRSGTAAQDPIDIDGWMWGAVAGQLALAVLLWLVTGKGWALDDYDAGVASTWRIQKPLDGAFARRHDPARACVLGALGTFLLLVGLPWVASVAPGVIYRFPIDLGGINAATAGVVIAGAATVFRYFKGFGSAVGQIGRVRGGRRLLDALLGLIVLIGVVYYVSSLLALAAANGPEGRIEGFVGGFTPLEPPSISRWSLALLFLPRPLALAIRPHVVALHLLPGPAQRGVSAPTGWGSGSAPKRPVVAVDRGQRRGIQA